MVQQNEKRDEDAQVPGAEQPQAADEAAAAQQAAPAPQEAAPAAQEEALASAESRLAEAEKQAEELRGRLLRALAEAENVRRRGERDVEDARKYAIAEFARELLGVADNLQRALASVSSETRQNNPELAAFLAGVELTERELLKALEKHGVRPVEALGRKLDPNLHQAVTQFDRLDAEPGEIVEVFQTGYTIADRLLRPAMVAVARRPAEAAGERLDTRA